MDNSSQAKNKESVFQRLSSKAVAAWNYFNTGVWSDPRRKWWINMLRTINLSMNSFLNRDIQTQACAMTYRTMLAVVPALAMFIAIGRGFGIQTILQEELYSVFPAQKVAIAYAMNFVDSYLQQASEGIIVGVGLVFLLYTLISLISNVEDTFNYIWGQKTGRSLWRKISDYSTMLILLPLLLICASGASILLSSTLRTIFHFSFMTPVITLLLEALKVVMTFLFFAAVYMLIPNAKVKFTNAFISGVLAGTGFLLLQWAFVSGTLYVAKYNAIYGSFAFLPLMLLWMQLAWVICLAGAVVCYSSQNVFAFSLENEVAGISNRYRDMVTLAIASVLAQRFVEHERPATARDIMDEYGIPARLVTGITDRLCAAGFVNRVLFSDEKDTYGFQLAVEPSTLTVSSFTEVLYNFGTKDFIPDFDKNFPKIASVYDAICAKFDGVSKDVLLSELPAVKVTTPNQHTI
ncbi:MAG: YihY/virulence factor BrkB family protein [Bacteroidales bacterium]|nr:YihY/virulence factor BrkB family protein [Bacteroidales bacterium]